MESTNLNTISEEGEDLVEGENSSTKMNKNNYKERIMYIWSVPAKGHSNPALCFTNELLKKLDDMQIEKIVFYSCESFRDSILNLPNNIQQKIEFRDYEFVKNSGTDNFLKLIMDFDTRPGSLFRFFQCWENSLKLGTSYIFKKLLDDMHRENPILVLYDQALFFPKITLKLYSKLHKNDPQPLRVCFVTSFLFAKDVYPLWSEMFKTGMMGSSSSYAKNVLLTIGDFFTYTFKYYKTLWWDNGFTFYDLIFNVDIPFARNIIVEDSLNLVFVLPEVQPKQKQFEAENIKFVGPALDENVRSQMTSYSPIERFLSNNEKPLIYVSMGTVFNFENSSLFNVIVEACKSYTSTHSVIVSTGDEKTYEKYSKSSSEDFLFVPHTPQIDILKVAKLFITHAGMNSVSEALHFGVPIICMPLFGDQPFVAWRVAEELGIGVRLGVDDKLTVNKVKNAISDVLNDPEYHKNVTKLSIVSNKYNGPKLAVQYLVDYMQQNDQFLVDFS